MDDFLAQAMVAVIRGKFEQIEFERTVGLHFGGERVTLVDAEFAPVFRYFDMIEQIEDCGFFARTPRVRVWRIALAAWASVQGAVSAGYPTALHAFLLVRKSALSKRIEAPVGT